MTASLKTLRFLGLLSFEQAQPRSPWQNAHVERLIGSIRRECLDHVVVLGEAHLRRTLATYASYYNELRTHRSLTKDTPLHRAVERLGAVTSRTILGGLHHQYSESNIRYRQVSQARCFQFARLQLSEFTCLTTTIDEEGAVGRNSQLYEEGRSSILRMPKLFRSYASVNAHLFL
jgi:hypothetical protein